MLIFMLYFRLYSFIYLYIFIYTHMSLISNLFEFPKSFFKVSKHKIRAPFLVVETNMHILNLNIS